jgi:hypothetical protein
MRRRGLGLGRLQRVIVDLLAGDCERACVSWLVVGSRRVRIAGERRSRSAGGAVVDPHHGRDEGHVRGEPENEQDDEQVSGHGQPF